MWFWVIILKLGEERFKIHKEFKCSIEKINLEIIFTVNLKIYERH